MTDAPWNKKVPSKGKSMTASQVASAKARARAAGRPYPNLVDNMAAMKEDAEVHSKDKKKPSSRFDASDELVSTYAKDTPGQCSCDTKGVVKKVVKEALYQGREVPLNKPMKGDVKKSKVYVRNSKGNVVKVNFGDKNLSIKKGIPARKRSYCARSGGQGNLTDKTSANYWSRRAWKC